MKLVQKFKALRRAAKIAVVAASLLFLYTVVGFLILPAIIRSVAEKKIGEALGRPTTIEKIRINPFALSASVEGLSVREPEGDAEFVALDSVYVNVQLASVWGLAPRVREVRVDSPYVRVVHEGDGVYNFTDLLTGATEQDQPAEKPDTAEEKKPFRFSVSNIQILNGRADFEDLPLGKTHEVRELQLLIPRVSNLAEKQIETFVEPGFSVLLDGKSLSAHGRSKPFDNSLETVFALDLNGLDLSHYFAYVPVETHVDLASGTLDLTARLTYVESNDATPRLFLSGELAISDLAIQDLSGNPLVGFDLFEIALARSRPLAGQVHVARIALEGPQIDIARNAEGAINFYSLMSPASDTHEEVSPSPPGDPFPLHIDLDEFRLADVRVGFSDALAAPEGERPDRTNIFTLPLLTIEGVAVDTAASEISVRKIATNNGALRVQRQRSGELVFEALVPVSDTPTTHSQETPPPPVEDAPPTTPWIASLDALSLTSFSITGENLASPEGGNLALSDIRLEVQDAATSSGALGTMEFSCRLNDTATISNRGQFGIAPPSATVDLNIGNLNLAWFQPFVDDMLAIVITNGALSTTASLTLAPMDTEEIQASVQADVSLQDFSTIEKADGKDLIKWSDFRIDGIDMDVAPLRLDIGRVALDDFYSRVILEADGSVNLQNIVASDGEATTATETVDAAPPEVADAPTTSPGLPLTIGGIALQRAHIDFTDRTIAPAYAVSVEEMDIEVGAISADEIGPADLSVQAKLDGVAPFKVSGTINPLAEDLFVNLNVHLGSLDLSPMSPYTGKFVGHGIEMGKLSLDLSYLIKQKELESRNKVLLDQFSFGDRVEDSEAARLPVNLAVALLKDRHGKISIDLPISGRIDDPEFHVGKIIFKTLVNLIAKAATSPFSMLASMFGSEEDLSYIEFEAGVADLTDDAQSKLDTLVTALGERPGLDLEVSGFVDTETDSLQLRGIRLEERILFEKLKEVTGEGQPTLSLAAVRLEPGERGKYLNLAYDAGGFVRPTDATGALVEVTRPDMEAAILATIEITDEDLGEIAKARAKAVQGYVLSAGKVDQSRLFLVMPESITPEATEDVKNSRVDLGFR